MPGKWRRNSGGFCSNRPHEPVASACNCASRPPGPVVQSGGLFCPIRPGALRGGVRRRPWKDPYTVFHGTRLDPGRTIGTPGIHTEGAAG